MRRMNKILNQSNTNDNAGKKKPKNGLKQDGKNSKFNKLLNKENEKNKQRNNANDSAAGSSSSPDSDQKKKDISVYDFESDEETDIFIGTYNSRFTPQILAKIEQEKAAEKDDSKKPSSTELESESSVGEGKTSDGNLSSNEIKARRLFSRNRKRAKEADHVRPKGTASKFSKLFDHRKSGKGIRGRNSKISARRAKLARTKLTKKVIRKGARDKAPNQEASVAADTKDTEYVREAGDFEVFKENMIEKVDTEHPEFTDEQVDDYLEKLWSEMDDSEKAKYVFTRLDNLFRNYSPLTNHLIIFRFKSDYESASDDGEGVSAVVDDDVKSSGNENDDDSNKSDEKRRSSSPSSSIVPSSSKPKKLSSIFTGYKAEKVCQICEKPGDTVRCRGPCGGTFHVECVEKLIATKDICPVANAAPRRGRRKKSSFKPIAEDGAAVESAKVDVDPELATENKSEEAVTSKRSKKSIAVVDTTKEDSSDKSKDNEFVKPVLRRSRRTIDKVQNIVEKENLENKDKSDPSTEVKVDADNEPPSDTACEEKSHKKPVNEDKDTAAEDEPKADNENVEDTLESGNDADVEIEKPDTEIGDKSKKTSEKDAKVEKTNSSDETIEKAEKIPLSDEKNSTEKSVKSENIAEACKEEKSTAPTAKDSIPSSTSKTEKSTNGVDFMCNLCTEKVTYPCFICGKNKQENTGETERIACHQSKRKFSLQVFFQSREPIKIDTYKFYFNFSASCARVFHKECLKSWPQATWITNNAKPKNGSSSAIPKESLLCPQHYCHTCISDNPAALKNRQGQAKLVRCIRCPTTYHQSEYLV